MSPELILPLYNLCKRNILSSRALNINDRKTVNTDQPCCEIFISMTYRFKRLQILYGTPTTSFLLMLPVLWDWSVLCQYIQCIMSVNFQSMPLPFSDRRRQKQQIPKYNEREIHVLWPRLDREKWMFCCQLWTPYLALELKHFTSLCKTTRRLLGKNSIHSLLLLSV